MERNNVLLLILLLIWHKQAFSHYIPKLVTFWGQNRANAVLDTVEMNLASLCSFESPYSTIVVGYVSRYVDHRNEDFLPGMGFSVHCARPQDRGHTSFLYCPLIGRDIRYCQQRGKKILIGIGGPGSFAKFESAQGAERFANLVWNLFLGGDETNDLRPFGSVILNGINFFMQFNDPLHANVFIRTLHQLRSTDPSRRYLLTISPSCMFPDPYFGPEEEKILDISTRFIDEIYVRFTDSACCMKGSLGFRESLNRWKNFVIAANHPKLYIGVPAALQATRTPSCYRSPLEMIVVYNSLKTNPRFRGFAVIDNSFDLQNLNGGFLFSKPLLSSIQSVQPRYHNHYIGGKRPFRYRENSPVIIPVRVPIKVVVPVKVPVPVPAPYPVLQSTIPPVNVWTRPVEPTNKPTVASSITTSTFQYPTDPIIPSTANPIDDDNKDVSELDEDVDENSEDDDINSQVLYPTSTTISPSDVSPENKTDDQDLNPEDLEESLDDDDDDDEEEQDEDAEDEEKQYTVFDQASLSEPTKKLPTRRPPPPPPPLYLPKIRYIKMRANDTPVAWKNQHPIFLYQPFYKNHSVKYSKNPKKDVVKKINNHFKKTSFDKKSSDNSIYRYSAPKSNDNSIYRYSAPKSFNTSIYRYKKKQMKEYFDQNRVKNYKILNKTVRANKVVKKLESKTDLTTFLRNILRPGNDKEYSKSKKKHVYNILPREDKIDIIYDSPTKKDKVTGKIIKGTNMDIVIDVPNKKSKLSENVSSYGVSIKATCGKKECSEYINPKSFYKNREDLFFSTDKLENYKRNIDLSKFSPSPIEELEEEFVNSLLGRFADDSDGDEVNEEETDLMSKNEVTAKRHKLRNNPIEYNDQVPIKKQMEFRIPIVAKPINSANGELTINDQMQENEKYLKLLQEDFQKQLDQFNSEIIKQQPVNPSEVNQNNTFPYNVKESELEKIIKGDLDIGKVQLRDLISNVNVKGNMDHLKTLMSAMQNDINKANNAIIEREKNVNEKQTGNKSENAPKNL